MKKSRYFQCSDYLCAWKT